MADNQTLYTFSQINQLNLTDKEILNLLKREWGFSDDEKIIVYGQITQIAKGENDFWVIDNFYHAKTHEKLLYPVNYKENIKQTIYIDRKSYASKYNLKNEQWIKAELELSSIKEREKHNNPFGLIAIKIENLTKIPLPLEIDILGSTKTKLIEKQWYDALCQKITADIDKEVEIKKSKITQLDDIIFQNKNTIISIEEQIKFLNDEKSINEQEFQKLKKENEEFIQKIQHKKQSLIDDLQTYQQEVTNKMNKLNQFIEQKANMLYRLNLIGDEEYHQFVSKIEKIEDKKEWYDFKENFKNINEAISYIQFYLYKRGIIYPRHVLEDFYALIRTHDLIILAGDSGSGKTHLVKSFANAIGGQSIIIPVKPNWTSAEDLLGYYNPLEQKYLVTPFLQAIFDAIKNPNTPYLICLDEMNLARVEYYFADFLSLMEERSTNPTIYLYSETEANHIINEAKMFLSLIDEVITKSHHQEIKDFVDLLKDETINQKLHDICGFKEGDSLLKYHSYLRRLLNGYLLTPSSIKIPPNVRIIGAINVDETTHYLSPKILDRAHIMRFSSPLLLDWEEIEDEIQVFEYDDLPVSFSIEDLGVRQNYPSFDRNDLLVQELIYLAREYLNPIGIEFGLRTIRQAQNYAKILEPLNYDDKSILNNIIMHKVLPKLMFDGNNKLLDGNIKFNENNQASRSDSIPSKADCFKNMIDYLSSQLDDNQECIKELQKMYNLAMNNDWIVNYWTR